MKPLSKQAVKELNRLNKLDIDALDMARDLYDISMKQRDYEKAAIYAEIEAYLIREAEGDIYSQNRELLDEI